MSIQLKKAAALAKQQDYASAYKILAQADARGNAEASYALATWYIFGRYVKKDLSKAVDYLVKAAKKGNADALFNLAVCYEKGAGVDKNLSKAYELYLMALVNGDFSAAYELGRMCYYGLGVTKNMDLAESFIAISQQKRIPVRRYPSKAFSRPSRSTTFQLA